jgi:hypothetical protein
MPCADNTHTTILQPFVPPDTGVQYCFKSPFLTELVESLMSARDLNYSILKWTSYWAVASLGFCQDLCFLP